MRPSACRGSALLGGRQRGLRRPAPARAALHGVYPEEEARAAAAALLQGEVRARLGERGGGPDPREGASGMGAGLPGRTRTGARRDQGGGGAPRAGPAHPEGRAVERRHRSDPGPGAGGGGWVAGSSTRRPPNALGRRGLSRPLAGPVPASDCPDRPEAPRGEGLVLTAPRSSWNRQGGWQVRSHCGIPSVKALHLERVADSHCRPRPTASASWSGLAAVPIRVLIQSRREVSLKEPDFGPAWPSQCISGDPNTRR